MVAAFPENGPLGSGNAATPQLLTTEFSAGDSVPVEMVDGQIKLTLIQRPCEPTAEKPETPEKPPIEPVAGKGKGQS